MTNDADLMPELGQEDAFEVQMRGYSRRQVDEFVARTRAQIRDLEERLSRSLDDIERGRLELSAARQDLSNKPAHEEISERVGQILKLADDEAKAQRTRAQDEIVKQREDAKKETERYRTEAREQTERMLTAAQEQAENAIATARAEAEKLRNSARIESERAVGEATKEAGATTASAKAQAKQMLDEATMRATAIHDGAERRLNLLTSRHTETMRRLTEIRPLSIEVGLLPRTHGSALFQRGQTQILSVATLGPSGDEQIIDTLSPVDSKRFMHHYNFPPYSVGEVRPLRGAGRREIGHGALAERALLPVIPTKEEFPYTIRVVSETLGSNGSTSMASTCGACLALMDAGVPMKAMIGGISIGLVLEGGQHRLLTDIQGMEDNYGDMDFKVTGSDRGVTAIQLDIKAKGLPVAVIREAFQQAKDARLFILNAMRAVLPAPRTELSKYAPRIETIKIAPDKVREVIGPGGKMVRQIQSETGTTIELEDDGTVRITGAKPEGREKARAMIEGLTKEPEVGEVYEGKVTRIMGIGAFVEYLPGKEGLVRISELSTDRVNRVEDVVNVGDTVTVKIAEVDRMGRVNLSIRAVSEGGDGYQERQRAERARYQDRDERGGPRRGGGGGFRRGGPPR